jgi:hypothetical protein
MKRWLNDLDRVLRGEATRVGELGGDRLHVPLGGMLLVVLVLAIIYGVCMGFYAGFREEGPCYQQWLAGAVKVPALFLLTLAVTFPSLYVFNALVGSRLRFVALLQLLVTSLAVNVAVLASLGPVVAFFSVSTTSYPFMMLLNILVFFISGSFGFAFLLQTLYRWNTAQSIVESPCPQPNASDATPPWQSVEPQTAGMGTSAGPVMAQLAKETGALWGMSGHGLDPRVKTVFFYWMLACGLVTAQMAWVLRPFLGKPSEPFHWFCTRESNFLRAVWDALCALLG